MLNPVGTGMRALGPIARLQVQRSGLKVAAPSTAAHPRYFQPGPLLEVAQLLLTPDGVLGVLDGQAPLLDVHHADHPETRNVRVNGVSIGFTAHYAAMRARFGAHLADGIAGENVIVDTAHAVASGALARGLAIQTQQGQLVRIEQVRAAEPCVEFARYALRLADDERSGPAVTEALQFLLGGMRGFYASYTGSAVVLRAGDAVFALD